MKMNDLNDQLDFDKNANSKTDKELYTLLINHLNQEPRDNVPVHFSDQVRQRLRAKHRNETIRENILFGFAILSVLGFGVLSLLVAGNLLKSNVGIPSEVIALIMVMGGLIVIFQTLDQKLIKRRKVNQLLG